jgi:hypothetical protein
MTGYDYGRLGRLGALRHRRRRRVVFAWVAALAGRLQRRLLDQGLAVRACRDGAQGALARRAADTATVVWKVDQGAQSPAIRARVGRFAELF